MTEETSLSRAFLVEVTIAGLGFVALLNGLGDAFEALYGQTMLVDVDTYVTAANGMTVFFDTGLREPLHPLWLRIAMMFSSDAQAFPRVVTALQTLLLALGLYGFTRAHLGVLSALTVMWACAFNITIHFYGVSGLRDPLYSAQMVWFFWFMFLPSRTAHEKRWTLSSTVAAALLYLTRVYGLMQVLFAAGWFALRERVWRAEKRSEVVRRAGIVVGATLCVLVVDRVVRGPNNVGLDVVYWWSRENQGIDPTDKQMRMSLLDYVFDHRTVVDVIWRVLSNHVLYVRNYLPSFCHGYRALAPPLFLIGVAFALARRREYIVLAAISALAPVVFVLNIDQVPTASGIDKRLVLPAFVMSLSLMAWAPWCVAEAILRELSKRVPSLRPAHDWLVRWHAPRS